MNLFMKKCRSLLLMLFVAAGILGGMGSLQSLAADQDIVAIMNEMGYEFAIPGNHEFDYKMPQFMRLASLLSCGYYSANFTDAAGNRIFVPYKMFRYGDTKLAMVGVTTPESFTKSTPAYFQDEAGNYIYGFSEDETGEKLYAAVQCTGCGGFRPE